MSWISDEEAEFWLLAEDRYLEWCDKNGVEPYICPKQRCNNHLPCRKHPPNIEGLQERLKDAARKA